MKTIFTTLIFCVLSTITYAQDKMFRHTATNDGQTYTMLDHPLLNGKPDARPIVSKFGGNISFTTQIAGVFYNETLQKWGIYNENLLPMTADHEFTVYVPSPQFSLTQVAADDYYTTEINHPVLNGKPDTFAVMTHVIGGVYNNQPVAFWYDDITTDGKWNIYDEDGNGAIPGGTKFFVAVEGEHGVVAYRHVVTDNNSSGYLTSVYHPLMANANARFVWAHNTGRQGASSATELKSSMQAYFSNPYWRIAMEDLSDIPVGTVLDFLIYDPNAMSTEDLSGANSIQVFPNPIIDNVNFKSKNTIHEISIYDMTGKKVLSSEKQSSSSVQMSATSLPAGIYTARIKTNKGFESLKLIKK